MRMPGLPYGRMLLFARNIPYERVICKQGVEDGYTYTCNGAGGGLA